MEVFNQCFVCGDFFPTWQPKKRGCESYKEFFLKMAQNHHIRKIFIYLFCNHQI